MGRSATSWIRLVGWVVALLATLAAVAQAIRESSLGPILAVGWVPAVLAATLNPRTGVRCRPRWRRRTRA